MLSLRRIICTVRVPLAVISLLIFLFVGWKAYMVSVVDATGTPITDGFGRPLLPTPWLMRYLVGASAQWPGAKWFFIDWGAFIGVNCLLAWMFEVEADD